MIRFTGQNGAYHAGAGAQRRTARHRVAPVMPISSLRGAPLSIEMNFVPQGGAKAP